MVIEFSINFRKIPSPTVGHDTPACIQYVVARSKLHLYLHSFGVTDIEGLLSVESTILRSEDMGSLRGLGVKVWDWGTVTAERAKLWF